LLLKTQVVSSTVPGIAAGTNDLLYFTSTSNQSSGTVRICWTFKISAYNFTTLILPYAGATSGASNYKYAISTDLGGGTPITVSSSANPLLISKSSDKSLYGLSQTALFTVAIQNPSAYPVSIDKITDQIPAGFSYQSLNVASGVTTSNSTSYPSTGATGTITFEGGVVSGANASYVIPAGGSIVLKYTAVAPASTASNLTTTARGYIGTTEFGSAQNTVGVSGTLPINIQSFKGSFVNQQVKLEWITSSEVNSSVFEIQRSNDGVSFSKIGVVDANHNSSVARKYSFVDSSVISRVNHYRLRIVDIDGSFKYSDVISLKTLNTPSAIVLNNPFSHSLQLKISLPEKQNVQLLLFDSRGRMMVKKVCYCNAGENSIDLNTMILPKGIYFLQASFGGKYNRQEVVKN